jgi:hypothetical protein
MGVLCFQNYGQLVVVDPPFGPVDFWLDGNEPGVPQDHSLGAQFCKEEPHVRSLFSCAYFQVCVELDFSFLVGSPIDVIHLPGVLEAFYGEAEMHRILVVYEVFCRSCV